MYTNHVKAWNDAHDTKSRQINAHNVWKGNEEMYSIICTCPDEAYNQAKTRRKQYSLLALFPGFPHFPQISCTHGNIARSEGDPGNKATVCSCTLFGTT